MISKLALWLIFNVYLGRLAPWVFGLALGRWPHRAKDEMTMAELFKRITKPFLDRK